MALIRCCECGDVVSSLVSRCPTCRVCLRPAAPAPLMAATPPSPTPPALQPARPRVAPLRQLAPVTKVSNFPTRA